VTFHYDHRTGNVATSLDLIAVAVGSFQSEMGCAADWDPGCMRAWLQDPDGDGELTLATSQVPPGSYEAAVAVAGGPPPRGAATAGGAGRAGTVPVTAFTVESPDSVVTFRWRGGATPLRVTVAPPPPAPDLAVADARWLDARTVAWPAGRLPEGQDPARLTFRLHRGDDLAVDAMSLGGTWVALSEVPAPAGSRVAPGDVVLGVPGWYDPPARTGAAAEPQAIGVYDDSGRLVDATGVAPAGLSPAAVSPGPP
jgi:hypothetical protein